MFVLFLMVLLMVLMMMLSALQELEIIHALLVGWHHVLDESDTNVLTEGVLDLCVGDILIAG